MYAILSEGTLLALCDKPRYVKLNESSGTYIETDEKNAATVAVNGNLYNINGKNYIPGAPKAIVLEKDASEYVFLNRLQIAKNEEHTNIAIVKVENALCDLDIKANEKLIVMENALCELDGIINGGENE